MLFQNGVPVDVACHRYTLNMQVSSGIKNNSSPNESSCTTVTVSFNGVLLECSFSRGFDFGGSDLSGFSKSAVSIVFKSWNWNPQSFSRTLKCSSSLVFPERGQCLFLRILWHNNDSTVLQLTQITNQGSSQSVSTRTIHRSLQRIIKQTQVPVRKLPISVRNGQILSQSCRERRHLVMETNNILR
ncbi:uncharacterized protein TNCV_1331341 [Trichonephila clavipes]|nr:uncharacterized protein TNCV_1331341 [Trichonephila clavipes]